MNCLVLQAPAVPNALGVWLVMGVCAGIGTAMLIFGPLTALDVFAWMLHRACRRVFQFRGRWAREMSALWVRELEDSLGEPLMRASEPVSREAHNLQSGGATPRPAPKLDWKVQ